MHTFNKITLERHHLISDTRTIDELDGKSLNYFLGLEHTEFVETIPTYGKHYTTLIHVFESFRKDYRFKIQYESTVIH